MKLTAQLAKSQLQVNRRRTIWTLAGIVLSSAILSAVYGLGFGTGLDFVHRIWGDSPFIERYYFMIMNLAVIMSVFIIAIAIIVISNAFRVSASERFSQFGILKSVGATQKQIKETIIYEGLYLTMIGIPLGLVIGIALQFISVEVINYFFMQIDPEGIQEMGGIFLNFIISPLSIILSISISVFTVFLSAWLPARKAAKIPAINAIRGIGEVKVKNKKVLFVGFIGKVFKIEGILAIKFLSRSKGNFRATVIALSFSIILVVATGGMFSQLNRTAEMGFGSSDANVVLTLSQWGERVENEAGVWEQRNPERMMNLEEVQSLTNQLEKTLEEGETIFFYGIDSIGSGLLPSEMVTNEIRNLMIESWSQWGEVPTEEDFRRQGIRLLVVNQETYLNFVELAGVNPGDNILLNFARNQSEDGRRSEFIPFNFNEQTIELQNWSNEEDQWVNQGQLTLHGQLLRDEIPVEFLDNMSHQTLSVIVPEGTFRDFFWFADVVNPDGFIAYAMETVFDDWGTEAGIEIGFSNIQEQQEAQRMMVNLIAILSFSFVGLLVTIALTNVISTISENVRTRSKEFAVLQSIGMTREGIKRMLGLEALLSSIKALLIGLPSGALVTYALHQAMGIGFSFDFEMPWIPMGAVTLGVFIITWLTMRYAANKLKDKNIIETIRSGSGVS